MTSNRVGLLLATLVVALLMSACGRGRDTFSIEGPSGEGELIFFDSLSGETLKRLEPPLDADVFFESSMAFVSSDSSVDAIDATGARIWAVELPSAASRVTSDDALIFLGHGSGTIAVERTMGNEVWRNEEATISDVGLGFAVLDAGNRSLIVEASTGEVLADLDGNVRYVEILSEGVAVVARKRLLAVSSDGVVQVLGKGLGNIRGIVAAAAGVVVVEHRAPEGSEPRDKTLSAYDFVSGELKWRHAFERIKRTGQDGSSVHVLPRIGEPVTVIDLRTGELSTADFVEHATVVQSGTTLDPRGMPLILAEGAPPDLAGLDIVHRGSEVIAQDSETGETLWNVNLDGSCTTVGIFKEVVIAYVRDGSCL